MDGLSTWPAFRCGEGDHLALFAEVDVDATHRKLIWEDGKRLTIDEAVQRFLGDFPDFPVELIETHLIAWLEMEFVPKTYSQEQIDELDRLTETWVDDHYGQRQAALK